MQLLKLGRDLVGQLLCLSYLLQRGLDRRLRRTLLLETVGLVPSLAGETVEAFYLLGPTLGGALHRSVAS